MKDDPNAATITEYEVQGSVVSSKVADNIPLELVESNDLFAKVTTSVQDHPWTGVRVGPANRYAAVYRNGRIMTAGCTSIPEAEEVLEEVKTRLSGVTSVYDETRTEIENIVATTDVGPSVNLEHLAMLWGLENVEYEPEQFPGLMALLDRTGATALIFSTGKVVITGVRSFRQVEAAIAEMRTKIETIQ